MSRAWTLFEFTGHATDAAVEQGRVREEDKCGNNEADTAADLGTRHQSEAVMDARRVLLNARCFFLLMLDFIVLFFCFS